MESKKNPKANLEKKKNVFFQIGLVTALALVLAAFEYRTFEKSTGELSSLNVDLEEEELIPITMRTLPPPPPPPPAPPVLDIVDNKEIVEEIEIEETEVFEETEIAFYEQPAEEEEEENQIFIDVEEMPSFPGGETELFRFLKNNVKFPHIAKDAGISGKVFINFVVYEDGSIRDIKLLNKIGGGCDEEAVRVVKKMPRWSPGKQRGKAVKVSYNLPIRFTLKR